MELNLEKIKEARENIKPVIRETPLFCSDTFSLQSGNNIYLKCEDKQKTGSFKLRGAYNKIASLTDLERNKGVIASSAGNHAQGVAFGATAFGIKSTVIMPVTAPLSKVQATRNYGAEVIQMGEVYDDCYEKALEIQQKTHATFIHPFDDIEVMAGQGTIALELLQELPSLDAIIVPIGGGGLISGIAVAAKTIKPSVKIIGVQAAIIASSYEAIKAGKVVTLPGVKSLADGISVSTPGHLTFEYMNKYVDDIVTVTEDEIAYAIFSLMERNKLVAEGAGAAALAAVMSDKITLQGKNIVTIISGGNIDIAMVSKIIERELILLKRRIRFIVELQDRVGQLGELITMIGELRANIIKTSQERNWMEKWLEYTTVLFEVETDSKEHSQVVIESLSKKGYKLKVIS